MPVVNIKIQDDADFQYLFVYKVGGVPLDFTGATLEMGVRRRATDKTAVLDLTIGSGIAYDDAVNGRFVITILKEKLEIMPPGDYVHSLIMTKAGLRSPIWSGALNLSKGPTR
jgi:hypothetical protein